MVGIELDNNGNEVSRRCLFFIFFVNNEFQSQAITLKYYRMGMEECFKGRGYGLVYGEYSLGTKRNF